VSLLSCDIQFAVGISSYENTFYYIDAIGRVSISEVAIGQQPIRSSGVGLLLSDQTAEIKPAKPGSFEQIKEEHASSA